MQLLLQFETSAWKGFLYVLQVDDIELGLRAPMIQDGTVTLFSAIPSGFRNQFGWCHTRPTLDLEKVLTLIF